jgi:hypothetical protein
LTQNIAQKQGCFLFVIAILKTKERKRIKRLTRCVTQVFIIPPMGRGSPNKIINEMNPTGKNTLAQSLSSLESISV